MSRYPGNPSLLRHSGNHNLTLVYDCTYNGFRVQVDKCPFIVEYLDRLHQTISRALAQYPRVFAFRVDPRLPVGPLLPGYAYSNEVIERFIKSFKAKIKHNRARARLANKYAHDSEVRYFWVREYGQHGKPHYHLVILLNYDAFNALGKFESGRDNIFNRLEEAWARALRLPVEAARGLVEIPSNAAYNLYRGDLAGQDEFFYRASYLCKAATKVFGNGLHGFGYSRT